MQQYTSEVHGNILTHCRWRATIEGRYHQRKTHYRVKYNLISSKLNNRNGISHYFQDSHQLRNFPTRRKICRVEHRKLLLRNAHGAVIIYEN